MRAASYVSTALEHEHLPLVRCKELGAHPCLKIHYVAKPTRTPQPGRCRDWHTTLVDGWIKPSSVVLDLLPLRPEVSALRPAEAIYAYREPPWVVRRR